MKKISCFVSGDLEKCLREKCSNCESREGCPKDKRLESSVGSLLGIIWLNPGRCCLRLESSLSQKSIPPEWLMFERCLAVPETREKVWGVLKLFVDDPPLEVEKGKKENIPLIALYLRELKRLCQRHLRWGFREREENLHAKAKGRPLPLPNLRLNVARGRPDRLYCRFPERQPDIPENRVLRAALELCLRYLFLQAGKKGASFRGLMEMALFCRQALAGVPVSKVAPIEVDRLRPSGIFKFYRQPLKLARLILKNLAYLWGEKEEEREIVPYRMDASRLFEYYCEALLRQGKLLEDLKIKKIQVQKKYTLEVKGKESPSLAMQPDFIVVTSDGGLYIADAKYRQIQERENQENENDENDDIKKIQEKIGLNFKKSDIYQVLAYSRLKELEGQVKGVILLYPAPDKREAKISGTSVEIRLVGVPLKTSSSSPKKGLGSPS